MEPSPLTRQVQPDQVFKPKVVKLYEELFKSTDSDPSFSDDDELDEKPEGYWRELFLLKPDGPALRAVLAALPASALLQYETRTQEILLQAMAALKSGRPAAVANALDTLAIFFSSVLSKKFSHPSSEIITVLAGLDAVDSVFTELVGLLEGIMRNDKDLANRGRAIQVLLAFTAGAYQTTLLTYLIQRDLFPAIMKYIHETPDSASALLPFAFLGLLANYNKFEFQNPYGLRLADFVNEAPIQKVVRCIGSTCYSMRRHYIDVQEDLPEGWSLSSTLSFIGLGRGNKAVKKPVYDAETAKKMFTTLPSEEAAVLLATYDFAHANKLFCVNLVKLGVETEPLPSSDAITASNPASTPPAAPASQAKEPQESPFASYISLSSYLLQHAYLSHRTSYYAHLSLMVFRLLVEDPAICKRLCSADSLTSVRLCRQRPPHLPLVKAERVLAAHLLDTMVDGITHNLRRRLDVSLYTQCVGIVLRLLSYLSRTRTRVTYHWGELFRSLLSLLRFMAQYVADLKDLANIDTLAELTVNVLALALSAGEAFLPSPAAYDDLFYKVVETGDTLEKFRQLYHLDSRKSSINTLVDVSAHYKSLLAEGGEAAASKSGISKRGNLTALQVAETIKQGYETLSIQTNEGLDMWEQYREADERSLLKKAARSAVGDVRILLERA
ncbi:hypothetical protein CFIMG_002935RA [Ceratocystis fimbriata CBS 114723]|uniref:Armadillo-like helical domain-containing protein n=1 Tax=Ceratocystis fimbriata CBS 114723 TaxID=1035309 RepID=A0A2C5X5K7_9PEZI|nr:hypothetical protein CFIMG_002935RA [Ceratocystis fimbriata CBS 114723]